MEKNAKSVRGEKGREQERATVITSDKSKGHPGRREKENQNHVYADLHYGDYPGRGQALSTISVFHGSNHQVPQAQKGPHNCPIIVLWTEDSSPKTQPGQNKKTGTLRLHALWGYPGQRSCAFNYSSIVTHRFIATQPGHGAEYNFIMASDDQRCQSILIDIPERMEFSGLPLELSSIIKHMAE